MTKITILGGTGFTGANIAREAAGRGHEVTSFSRTPPAQPVAGVRYETGSLVDDAVRRRAVDGADVVIGSLAAREAWSPRSQPSMPASASLRRQREPGSG